MPRIDANIIVRHLTNAPAEQAARVARLFDDAANGLVVLTVDDVTIAEAVRVLTSYYKIPRQEVSNALLRFMHIPGITCPAAHAVEDALIIFVGKNIDFIDALLGARMMEVGETEIYSFDRHLDRVPGIRRVEP